MRFGCNLGATKIELPIVVGLKKFTKFDLKFEKKVSKLKKKLKSLRSSN